MVTWAEMGYTYSDSSSAWLLRSGLSPDHAPSNTLGVTGDYGVLEADGIRRKDIYYLYKGLIKRRKENTPAVRISPITDDNHYFDVYDIARDRHYVGALLKEADGTANDDTTKTRGFVRAPESTEILMSYSVNGASHGSTSEAPTGWMTFAESNVNPTRTYYRSVAPFTSYAAAEQAAISAGGKLAISRDHSTTAALATAGTGFIGLQYDAEADGWMWNDGIPSTSFTEYWGSGENGGSDQPFASISTSGNWESVFPGDARHAFLEIANTHHHESATDFFMVPTSEDVFGIQYFSESSFDEPTILLLSEDGMNAQVANSNWQSNWYENSHVGFNTNQWNHALLLAPYSQNIGNFNTTSPEQYEMLTVAPNGETVTLNYHNPTYELGQITLANGWIDDGSGANILLESWTTPTSLLDSSLDAVFLTQPDPGHAMFSDQADVQVFQVNNFETDIIIDESGQFDLNKVKITLPLTTLDIADLSNLGTATLDGDVPQSGSDAVELNLPYWGVPNGVEGKAYLYLRVENKTNGEVFESTYTSESHPLLLNNCPGVAEDKIEYELPIYEMNGGGQIKFFGGDLVAVSAAGILETEGRRIMLWSHDDPEAVESLCSNFNPSFALKSPVTLQQGEPQPQPRLSGTTCSKPRVQGVKCAFKSRTATMSETPGNTSPRR